MESSKCSKYWTPTVKQSITAIGSLLSSTAAGMTSGYSSILLPQLQSNTSTIQISVNEASWIASMAPLPMAFGCIVGGLLMEKFGRKLTQMITNIPFAIGWLCIFFGTNLTWILIGRFLTGLCVGIVGAPISVYLGEISSPKLRGIFLGAVSFGISLGIFLAHLIGTFLNWKWTAFICGLFPLLSFLLLCLLPESPSWLLKNGKTSESIKAFEWLRGTSINVKSELNSMILNKTMNDNNNILNNNNKNNNNISQRLRDSSFTKPLFILLGFFFIMQFSGVNIVAFYCVTLLQQTLDENINEYMAMFVIDLVRIFISIIACVLIKNVGRRRLAFVSGIGTATSLLSLSIILYFDISNKYNDTMLITWLPFILLVSYVSFVTVGIVPLPWCMIGEIFPLASRGIGSGLTTAFNFLCFFIIIKTCPSLFVSIGTEGVFLLYGIIAFIGTIYLYFVLPETKNKTLLQIEEQFRQRDHGNIITNSTNNNNNNNANNHNNNININKGKYINVNTPLIGKPVPV